LAFKSGAPKNVNLNEMPSGKSNVHRGNKGGKEPQMEFEHAGAIIWLFYRPAHIYLGKKGREKRGKREKHVVVADGRCCTMPYYIH